MQSRKRRNPLKVTDVTRKVQARLYKYLGSPDLTEEEASQGANIPELLERFPDVTDFRREYLASELMSKYPDLVLGRDRKEVALTAFTASERVCLESNIRLQWCASEFGVDAVMSTARRILSSLLGEFDLDEMARYVSFSSGASTRLPRRRSLPPMKYSAKEKLHVTESCLPYAHALVKASPIWTELLVQQNGSILDSFVIVGGNRVTTVPKNAKTDRVIAIEPDMNMYVQKGIGAMIRRRLRKVGVDLNSQSKNQRFACDGSKDGDLATIDLKAASDTIAIELVRYLVPDSWYRHLMATRSRKGYLPNGTEVSYQKISSMGNGYTFELESAIFWALSKATLLCSRCKDHRLAIYGDDIILNSSVVDLLFKVFDYAGFTINRQKSFWQGPFRESCGKHFVNGVDVTPFYVRRPIDSVARLYWICNQFRRWATSPLGFGGKDSYETWRCIRNHIPKKWQLVIPEGIGDVGILGTLSEAPCKRINRCTGLIPIEYKIMPGAFLMYLYTLDSLRDRSCPSEESKTGDSESLKSVVPEWYKLNRYRLAGWQDPGYWVPDLEGPAGLV